MYSLVYYLDMPVTRSAAKKLRQDHKRESYNLNMKRAVKETISAYEKNPTPSNLSKVFSKLDAARKKNIFHKNKVARLKSRLSKKLKGTSVPKPSASKTAVKKKIPAKKYAK